jgi:potassium-transporting ATPase KdpC subunit
VQPIGDLAYTSGSSLDPHITSQLETLIAQNTDGRFLGIFGEPGVNVLKLNLALYH